MVCSHYQDIVSDPVEDCRVLGDLLMMVRIKISKCAKLLTITFASMLPCFYPFFGGIQGEFSPPKT